MKPISMTPYEIRLRLLELARTILQSKHDAHSINSGERTSPTTEDVLAEAEKLNVFVSKAAPAH